MKSRWIFEVHPEVNIVMSFCCQSDIWHFKICVLPTWACLSLWRLSVWQFHRNSTHQICFGTIVLYRDYALSRKISFSLNYCNLKLETDYCEPTFPSPPLHVIVLMREGGWVFCVIKSNHLGMSLPPITQWMPGRMLTGELNTLPVFFKFLLWKIF